jgi:hypothetical protein
MTVAFLTTPLWLFIESLLRLSRHSYAAHMPLLEVPQHAAFP